MEALKYVEKLALWKKSVPHFVLQIRIVNQNNTFVRKICLYS